MKEIIINSNNHEVLVNLDITKREKSLLESRGNVVQEVAKKVTEKFFKEGNTDTEKIFSLSLNDGIVVYYMVEGYNWKLRIAELTITDISLSQAGKNFPCL